MLREIKFWICGLVASVAVANVSAFSLLGPEDGEDWQVLEIGYQTQFDVGSPRNIGEEYRWNTPIVYYAFESSFLEFFGSNGVAAVDEAMAVFNSLSNVSVYSPDLSEFPYAAGGVNPTALALGLLDVKSTAMTMVLEELGLADPLRWTWGLHAREEDDDSDCPTNWQYTVVVRNYDIVTGTYSSIVNGSLVTYSITEYCDDPPPVPGWTADAVDLFTGLSTEVPVASGLGFGTYYTTLSRDDVAGLRYLFRTNNMNVEGLDDSATVVSSTSTNFADQQVVITSDLTTLLLASRTNTAAQLQALFPGLVVTSTTTSFQQVITSNTVVELVNEPYDPAGYPPRLRPRVVYTTNFAQIFTHTFGNVVTNSYYTNTAVTTITTNFGVVTCPPLTPAGTICFGGGSVSPLTYQNIPSGDYFLLPTNICNFQILSNLLTTVMPVTNSSTLVVDEGTGQVFFQATISYFTNNYLLINFFPCSIGAGGTNASIVLRQGMQKINFVRANYDSLLGQFFTAVVTNYTMVAVINNAPVVETIRRTVTAPDFVFAAADLAGGPDSVRGNDLTRSEPNWVDNSVGALAGPGTIEPPVRITYTKTGPIFGNSGPDFMDEASAFVNLTWGSFDGSTNLPIIYPDGASIYNLENQVLINVTPATLAAPANVFYSQQLSVSGGQYPYTFSEATGSSMPPGLMLSPSGLISGTPTVLGTYDFLVDLVDSSNRQVQKQITLTVN